MSALPSYFTDFLTEIRPTDKQKEAYQAAHQTLRDRLLAWGERSKRIRIWYRQYLNIESVWNASKKIHGKTFDPRPLS